MLDRALDTHPEALLVAVAVAVLIVVIAIAWAMDVFIGYAERDEVEPEEPAAPPLPTADALMAAHADVVRRHAADGATVRVR